MKTKELTTTGLSIAILTFSSYLSLPIGPVPMTLQTAGVFLISYLWGAKIGVTSVICYLILGLMGIPVFAGGSSGLSKIFSPTFGFLLSLILAAFIVGKNNEKNTRIRWLAYGFSTMMIYLFGGSYFYLFMNYYSKLPTSFLETIQITVLPFILGDIVKILLVELVGTTLRKVLHSTYYVQE